MDRDTLMAATQRMNLEVETLAALGARLRIGIEGLEVDSSVGAALDDAVRSAGIDPDALDRLPAVDREVAIGALRAFFAQAADLLAAPDAPPGWRPVDADLVDQQGRASAAIAGLVAGFAGQLDGLERRLTSAEGAFLDVGTGAGHLALAMARTFPGLRVVGIDRWEDALAQARVNVSAAAHGAQVVLRRQDVVDLDDPGAYDLVFLPGPFLGGDIVPAALQRTVAALRPGGWVLFGIYAGPPDPRAQALIDLRVLRSGGRPWRTDEAGRTLAEAGLVDVRAVERTWLLPMDFVAGRATGSDG